MEAILASKVDSKCRERFAFIETGDFPFHKVFCSLLLLSYSLIIWVLHGDNALQRTTNSSTHPTDTRRPNVNSNAKRVLFWPTVAAKMSTCQVSLKAQFSYFSNQLLIKKSFAIGSVGLISELTLTKLKQATLFRTFWRQSQSRDRMRK